MAACREFVVLASLAVVYACSGCSDSDDDSVLLSGVVRNIDNGSFAQGIRVSLWDSNFRDDVATGTDGAFALYVPKGSRLMLHTDDFGGQDDWFPLINTEYPETIVNEDMTDLAIHACPQTVCPELGSIATYNNFLQNGDGQNGDMFEPTNAASASAILVVSIFGGAGTAPTDVSGFTVTTDSPEMPIAYVRVDRFYNPGVGIDCSLGPVIVYPPGTSATDAQGLVLSFGGSKFSGDELSVTLTDTHALPWQNPLRVPVAPGVITMVLACFIDDEANIPFKDWARAMGYF